MIFLSDLDNTLIFSYKKMSPDNLCVETKEGKALSYMTRRGGELFGELVRRAHFIPITTRSFEQYSRITFPGGYVPEIAVTANGASLYINGFPDRIWGEETAALTAGCEAEFCMFEGYLRKCPQVYFEIRIVDGAFLFTKCREAKAVTGEMERLFSPVKTRLFTNGDKLYAVPVSIDKKTAAERLRRRFPGEFFLAAGDSLFDEGLLGAADGAVVKRGELSGKRLNSVQFDEKADDPDFALLTALKFSEFLSGE